MADNLLRPPTPDMQGRELVQWLQRVYDVLREYQTTPTPEPPDIPTSHNDLDDNGGDDSHATIASHIAASTAHGVSSPLVGITDVQSLANKVINALNNTITNLRHGTEVDNPTAAHGVGEIVGTDETQVLKNKDVRRGVKHHAGGGYTATLTDDLIICYALSSIRLPSVTPTLVGKHITIVNASSVGVSVSGNTFGWTINGEVSQILPGQSTMSVIYDGLGWRIV